MNDKLRVKNNELGGKMNYRYRNDEEMKDSGVEWIGKIPKEWSIVKGKYLFKNKKLKNSGGLNNILSLTLNGVIDRDKNNFEGLQPESFDGYQEFNNDNLVFKLIDLENINTSRVGYVHKDGLMSPAYIRLEKNKDIHVKYYYYNYFDYYNQKIYNFLGSVGVRSALNSSDLVEMDVINNKLIEQEKIAKFLDEKTAQFDSIISKKEALIEKLEEAKKSLISEVVTGKVRVVKTDDGYELVEREKEEMKDSGVEWVGDIPKEWDIKKVKHVLSEPVKYGANESAELDDRSLPRYIRITDFAENGKLKDETFKSLTIDKASGYYLNEGDILFARSGATVGKTFLFKNYKGKACFAGYLIKASVNKQIINPEFLYNFTKSKGYENWKNSIFMQATIQNIGADKYKELKFTLPNKNEQEIICKFIEDKNIKYNKLFNKINKQIKKLKEAKQSLISEAVTGKIEILD